MGRSCSANMAVVKPSTRHRHGGGNCIGVCSARLQCWTSCSVRHSHNQLDGIVTINNASTFCSDFPLRQDSVVPHHRPLIIGHQPNLQGLAPGDCLRLSYRKPRNCRDVQASLRFGAKGVRLTRDNVLEGEA